MGRSQEAVDKRAQTMRNRHQVGEDYSMSPLAQEVVETADNGFVALGELGITGFGMDRPSVSRDYHDIDDRVLTPLEATRYQESGSISPYD